MAMLASLSDMFREWAKILVFFFQYETVNENVWFSTLDQVLFKTEKLALKWLFSYRTVISCICLFESMYTIYVQLIKKR